MFIVGVQNYTKTCAFCKISGKTGKVLKQRNPLFKGVSACGLDGTRTREPLRDRPKRKAMIEAESLYNLLYIIFYNIFWGFLTPFDIE